MRSPGTELLALAMVVGACAHVPSNEQRLENVGPLQYLGEHQKAVDALRSLLADTSDSDTSLRGRIYVELAMSLLALDRTSDALVEARHAISTPGFENSEPWLETLVLLSDQKNDDAARALRRGLKSSRVSIRDLASARWLQPLRTRSDYASLVAIAVLSAGGASDVELAQLNQVGGIVLLSMARVVADPARARDACTLAVVQVRDTSPSASERTRVFAELVSPRVEATGTEFHEVPVRTTVRANTHATASSTLWGPRLISAWTTINSETTAVLETTESRPETQRSVVLHPQNIFAFYEYVGLDDALLPNQAVAIFGCHRRVEAVNGRAIQQELAPLFEVIAYLPFDSGGLPVRRAPSASVIGR